MASSGNDLSGADISQITDKLSAKNIFRFCVEYLGIDRNEYETIKDETKYIHHDILLSIAKWMLKENTKKMNL